MRSKCNLGRSQQYVPLTFSWKSMVAVRTAWGKSWLWVRINPWCCPGCDVTHVTLESNVLLGAPFPSATSSSLPPNHLLLHSFHLPFETSSQARFPSALSRRRGCQPCRHPMYVSELHNPPSLPQYLAPAVARGPEQPKSSPGPTPWLSPFEDAMDC